MIIWSIYCIIRNMAHGIDNLLAMTEVEAISGRMHHCAIGWRQDRRVLPDSMWYWLQRGRCACELDGDVRRFNPGELFMIPAGCPHTVWPLTPQTVDTITIHFHARCYAAGDITGLLSLGGVYSDDGLLGQISQDITAEFDNTLPGYLWNAQAGIKRVLTEIIRRRAGGIELGDSFVKLQRLGGVLQYIEQNLSSPLRTDSLAEIAGVSEVYLRRLFSMCSLPSPANYIIRRRIFCACELLKTTAEPIKKIAAASGFSDLPFFYRTFRKITGRTPAEFREHPEM